MGEILIGILREIIGGIIQGAMESLFLKYKKLTFGLISISWVLSGCILVKMLLMPSGGKFYWFLEQSLFSLLLSLNF